MRHGRAASCFETPPFEPSVDGSTFDNNSGRAAECSPRQLSFCAAQQFLATTWLLAAVSSHNLHPLIELRLTHSASHRVGNRPNRIEPHAIKR